MNRQLLQKLSRITEEEQHILDGDRQIDRENYTSARDFVVDSRRLLSEGQLIRVRTHTRFIDFPLHGHNYIEMMYVCQGNLTHCINGANVVMEEGDLLLLSRNAKHSVEAAGLEDIGINLVILPAFFDKALEMLEKSNVLADFLVGMLRHDTDGGQYLHFSLKGDLQVGNLVENLIYSLVESRDNDNVINKVTMGLLFMCLLQNIRQLRNDAPNNYEDVVMRSVLQYIDQHYQTATLTALAESMNRSLSAMSRLIKARCGHTFKELLQEKRFQMGLELLKDTNLPVSDIVTAVGYENSSYFHRRFRDKYQLSPKEFRRLHLNKRSSNI